MCIITFECISKILDPICKKKKMKAEKSISDDYNYYNHICLNMWSVNCVRCSFNSRRIKWDINGFV